MAQVRYGGLDAGLTGTAPGPESLLALSLRLGVPHLNECAGRGRCTTCRVRVTEGLADLPERTALEREIAAARGWSDDVRLACQLSVTADCSVERLVLADSVEAGYWANREAGAEAREAEFVVMFADLVNFSSFTSRHLPYDIIHVLNRVYTVIGQPVLDQGGFIDNYLGDGLLALFETTGSPRETCRRALRAVLTIQRGMRAFAPSVQEQFGWTPEIRIGLHRGLVVVGEIGHPGARRTTVLGDAVNIACRVEAANKLFGTRVLASAEFLEPVADLVDVQRMAPAQLPGYAAPFALAEIRGFVDFGEAAQLEASLAAIESRGEAFGTTFYERLFARDPELARHFSGVDLPAQQRKIVAALRLIVDQADNGDTLLGQLRALGALHTQLGIPTAAYMPARAAFEEALAAHLDPEHARTNATWMRVFDQVVRAMTPDSGTA